MSISRNVLSLSLTAALALGGALAVPGFCQLPNVNGSIPKAHAATKKVKNKRAHAAYRSQLASMRTDGLYVGDRYKFVDLTGDGVDELVVGWWPSIYTYRGGDAVKVHDTGLGGNNYLRFYKNKHVVVFHSGGRGGRVYETYAKWNGRKFTNRVSMHVASGFDSTAKNQPAYMINGKGVTAKRAKAVKKKLVGNAKATSF